MFGLHVDKITIQRTASFRNEGNMQNQTH